MFCWLDLLSEEKVVKTCYVWILNFLMHSRGCKKGFNSLGMVGLVFALVNPGREGLWRWAECAHAQAPCAPWVSAQSTPSWITATSVLLVEMQVPGERAAGSLGCVLGNWDVMGEVTPERCWSKTRALGSPGGAVQITAQKEDAVSLKNESTSVFLSNLSSPKVPCWSNATFCLVLVFAFSLEQNVLPSFVSKNLEMKTHSFHFVESRKRSFITSEFFTHLSFWTNPFDEYSSSWQIFSLYYQPFSLANRFITRTDSPSLGILTCLLLLPSWFIAAIQTGPALHWKGNRFLMSPQVKMKQVIFIFLGTGLERKRKIWIPPGTSWFPSVPARTWIPQCHSPGNPHR